MRIPKKVFYVAWVVLAVLAHGACRSSGPVGQKNEVVRGKIAQLTLVDSEHGDLNGVFSPKIIYDPHVDVKNSEFKRLKLLVTEKTEVYENTSNGLQRVAIDSFRGGDELEVTISNIDKRYLYPECATTRIIILQRH